MKSLRAKDSAGKGAESFIDGGKFGAEEKDPMVNPYPARLRSSLDKRVRDYLKSPHARAGESINSLINDGLEMLLDQLDEEIGSREKLLSKAARLLAEEGRGEEDPE